MTMVTAENMAAVMLVVVVVWVVMVVVVAVEAGDPENGSCSGVGRDGVAPIQEKRNIYVESIYR